MTSAIATKRPAAAKKQSRKAKIISVAKEHFALRGIDGASTRQIAAEAGVAQSLLLYHFATKEDLWKAVMSDCFDRATKMINPNNLLVELEPQERLQHYIRKFVAFCAEDADLHRLLTLAARRAGSQLDWLVENHLQGPFQILRDTIIIGQKEGWVRCGDPTLLYYSILSIAGTTYSHLPEIKRLEPMANAVDSIEIERLINALIFVG